MEWNRLYLGVVGTQRSGEEVCDGREGEGESEKKKRFKYDRKANSLC